MPKQSCGEVPGAGTIDGIAAFWSFWHDARDAITEALAAPRLHPWLGRISSAVDAIHPLLAWELGRGCRARHYLCLAAEGDMARRALTERWLAAAPAPDATWEYRAAKPGGVFAGRLEIADVTLDLTEVRVEVSHDEARERIHVTVHHPGMAALSDEARTRAAFIALDGALGEDEVERWVGAVETSARRCREALPLSELDGCVAAWRTPRPPKFRRLVGTLGNGAPVVALANLALKRVDHLMMDAHVEVDTRVRHPLENGLPTPAEQRALEAYEAELLDLLGHDAVHIASETAQGVRTSHFHVAKEGPALARLTHWERAHPERPVQIRARLDSTWSVLQRW